VVEFLTERNQVENKMVGQRSFLPGRVNRVSERVGARVEFFQLPDDLLNVTEAAEVRIPPIIKRLPKPENGFYAFEQDRKTVFCENVVMMYNWAFCFNRRRLFPQWMIDFR
jgi:hypothetical protein